MTIWIGEIQWMIRHGFGYRRDPILKPLDHIENRDALIDLTDPANPRRPTGPTAEFIVGNPPFLGNRFLRRGLTSRYTESLWSVFDDRLPHSSDLVCYWHEKARAAIAQDRTKRAGLLATQGIRGQANRRVLERINESGAIFFARSDEPWVLAGATVHISFVGQDSGSEVERSLDGRHVGAINPDLTSGVDTSRAASLAANAGKAFMGDIKVGPFDVDDATAKRLLSAANPDGRSNRDVVRPWMNGSDLTGIRRGRWIIDFGLNMSERDASLYEAPFQYVVDNVRPGRLTSGAPCCRARWWIHHNARPEMRRALAGLRRYIATPRVSKHRIFVWLNESVLLDSAAVAFAFDSDYEFGVLQSRVHEVWARATGTQLRDAASGFRYTSTTTFETFPFPHTDDGDRVVISQAAKRLNELREGWLAAPDSAGATMHPRSLTGLYNQRPTWLAIAHDDLDRAVLHSYGLAEQTTDAEILAQLMRRNLHERPRREAIG